MISVNDKNISMWALVFITIAGIASPIGMVIMAKYGLTAVFYYALVIILFFIPSGLIFSELASGWPQEGGMFHWVNVAFGRTTGNIALWTQWISVLVSFPIILTFIVGTIAYAFHPAWLSSGLNVFLLCTALTVIAVLSTCFGMKTSVKISALAALCSTIIPTILLIVFAAIWLLTGHHSVTPLQAHNFMPTSMHMSDWSLLGATVYMFAGLELAAYCLKYTRNAKRDYGRALLISGIIIVVLSVLGTLSIAVMVPAGKENLIAGMMQAFLVFLNAYHLHAVIYVIMALFIIGQVCVVSNYLMTLSEGLLSASKHHMLPKIFTKVSRHGSPINILMAQGAITIVISLLYFVVPDVNSAYWMIEAIVAIAGSFRYLIIFAAAFVLRFTHPKVPRSIRVPGGNWGIAMLSGAGFLIVAFAMAMTFLPPSQLKLQAIHTFYFWIISGTVLCFVLPLVVGYFSSFKHVQALEEEHNDLTHHGHH